MELCVICDQPATSHTATDHPFINDGAFRLATQRRGAQYDMRDSNPPSEVYVTLEDRLRVTLISNNAGMEVDFGCRILRPDGQVIVTTRAFLPTAGRSINLFEIDLAEGFLLDVVVSTPTTAVRRGNCFADVSVIRGTGANAIAVRNLIDAYIISNDVQGWPEVDNSDAVNGAGILNHVAVSSPAAGADWSMAVPTGARWRIRSCCALLTTSATVANRLPVLQIVDNLGHVQLASPFQTQQVASLAWQYSGQQGGAILTNGTVATTTLPQDLTLLQGWFIGTVTVGLQAADQWSAIQIQFEEWLEP